MSLATSFITCDKEFSSALDAIRSELRAGGGLPVAVNGLSGGAPRAFVAECILALAAEGGGVALVIERDEDAAAEIQDLRTVRKSGHQPRQRSGWRLPLSSKPESHRKVQVCFRFA